MPRQAFKKFLYLYLLILVLFATGSINIAHAAIEHNYKNTCGELEKKDASHIVFWNDAPSPMAIICPIARFLNVLVLSAGAIFVVFVFISAIKYALSQGDPKALQASKQTLTTAIIGMLIIIGVYTIVTIISNVLGLQGNAILHPFDALSQNLADLLQKFGVSD